MQLDVLELRDFYNRPLGGIVRRMLTQRIRARWRSAQGCTLMGLGFAVPYIGMFRGEASRHGLDAAVWGHVSDGNLHPNVIARTLEEWRAARQLVEDTGRMAIRLGGVPHALRSVRVTFRQ